MGLCKCPQRKVSTLFCFKHQVNVCESCLVNEHAQCIVRSYLSWLQDKDFSADCPLCHRSLSDSEEETIRLTCYDLFHWSCLNEYFRSFPAHTAPDGYTCPTCHTCVFPSSNLVSPVADQVRAKLAQATWANRLPMFPSNDLSTINIPEKQQSILTETEKNGYVIVNPSNSGLSHHPHRTIDMTDASTMRTLSSSELDDEDKYKRRSVFTWFARWLKSRQSNSRQSSRSRTSSTRLTIYFILIILLIFFTLITVLYHLTRGDNNENLNLRDDPQFNPLNNPLIRVGGRALKNPDGTFDKDHREIERE